MASTPEPLPSLPPSPTLQPLPDPGIGTSPLGSGEDVARAWHDDEPSTRLKSAKRRGKGKGKGKGKERMRDSDSEDDEEEDEGEEEDEDSAAAGYPPTKEEAAETRRIQENLRRWEMAERQRRKAARESASLPPPNPAGGIGGANAPSSLFADLFHRDSRKAPLGGVGAHHVLATTDDGVPLDDLDSDAPTIERPSSSSSPLPPEPENPFDTPNASRTSLNIPAHSAIMTESDTLPDELATPTKKKLKAPERPTLEASSSFAGPPPAKKQPPPPKPLDLPAPKAPPPLGDASGTAQQPEPTPSPSPSPERVLSPGPTPQQEEPRQPVRWWHEWMCGCGEGPDRGGEYQAGRTNPME
ncbi:hypothetical protein C8Q80DRAFT_276991 [Daedaleopsis nitida]|nr:hypothetical protein C8Q80DRAFT_276991 [Daedaleopsis nitida]